MQWKEEYEYDEKIDIGEEEKFKIFLKIKEKYEGKEPEEKNSGEKELEEKESKKNESEEKESEEKKSVEKTSEKENKIEGHIFKLDNLYLYNSSGKETATFFINSRFISFQNREISFDKKFFIHDQNSLKSSLNKAKIKEAVLIRKEIGNKNYDSNDSNNSINSTKSSNSLRVEEILNEGIITIKQEKILKISKIFSKENFDKRFVCEKVCELDLNFKYYKDYSFHNHIIDYNKLNWAWIEEIKNFYSNISFNSEIVIVGPRGVGKTINLLIYGMLLKIPRLYFSIKSMSKFNNRKWKKISLYESIYIFDNEEEMKEFEEYINKFSDSDNLMQFIFEFIKLILEFYGKKKRTKRFLIIFDDYDNSFDSNNIILNIKEYIHLYRDKLLLCTLGECPYIYRQYFNYFLNNNQNYIIAYWDSKLNDEEQKNILNLPLYFYKTKDLQNNDKTIINNKDQSTFDFIEETKKELRNDFKKIKFRNFISLSRHLNYYSNIRDLEDDFENFPLEFLKIEKMEEDNKIFFKLLFKLSIYKEIFEESIKGLLKIDNIKSAFILKNDEENNNLKNPIQFEEIIIEQLWNNTLGLEDFNEKNKIKVKDIYSIKSLTKKVYEIEKNKPVIIRQTNFCGKFYDLLLILGNKGNRIAIFIQIGLNKNQYEICNYYNNLYKHYQEYLKGLKSLINEEINFLGFLLIFDYDKQMFLRNKNKTKEGVGFCLEQDIQYLIYKNFKLYKDLESENPISSINFDKCKVLEEKKIEGQELFSYLYHEWCQNLINQKLEPNIYIDDKEKSNIIEFINQKYENNFSNLEFVTNMGEEIKGYLNFGFFAQYTEQINIINGNSGKFIYYKDELFKIGGKNGKIEKTSENYKKIFENKITSWDLYYLSKKRKRAISKIEKLDE